MVIIIGIICCYYLYSTRTIFSAHEIIVTYSNITNVWVEFSYFGTG